MKCERIVFFKNSIFLITLISLYILNNNRRDDVNLIILNATLSFFSLLYMALVLFICNKIKLHRYEFKYIIHIYICICAVILTYVSRSFINMHIIYLVVFYLLFYFKVSYSEKKSQLFLFICILSCIVQLTMFRFYDGRIVLSYFDPNYSGLMVFLLGAFCYYVANLKILSPFVFSIGLVFFSRTYIFVVLLFYLLIFFSKFNYFKKIYLFASKPIVSFFFVAVIPLVISYMMINTFDLNNVVINTADNKFSSLSSLIDRSNMDRSYANTLFFDDLINNPISYIWGTDTDRYIMDVFRNTPHNSFYQLIINYGIIYAISHYIIFASVAYHSIRKNYLIAPFYFCLSIYMMALGGAIYGISLIFIATIFTFSNKEKF